MLHSGHVAFFKEASSYGDLYVGIGSDKTVFELKDRKPVYSEAERLYMVKAIRYVKDACINTGSGMIDFEESVERFRPDIFIVNEDGSSEIKREFCRRRGIEYIVLKRLPDAGLEARSTTSLRNNVRCMLPFRLDLAGTWIDQPYVSRYAPGWAITISLEPTEEFEERCGMATSTRNAIRKIWPFSLPDYNPEMMAKLAFCFENEPSKNDHVSGAQDAIGICLPGLSRHYYDNNYWPEKIENVCDEETLSWLENHICMKKMFPRPAGTDVIGNAAIDVAKVRNLAEAADRCWESIIHRDLDGFASAFNDSFKAQTAMFPGMLGNGAGEYIGKFVSDDRALAVKMAGAGGGGYMAIVCERPLKECIRIKIRRKGE